MRTDRWLVALPIASYLWLFMTVLIAGVLHPGYSHVSQFMSELGAQGAPGGWMVNYLGFLPTEILFLAFVGLAFRRAGRDAVTRVGLALLGLYAVSLIIASFYPCDAGCRPDDPTFSHMVHIASGLGAYLFCIAGVLVLAVGCRRRNGNVLTVLGVLAGAFALFCFVQITPDNPHVGLYQRGLETTLYAWCIAFAVRLGAAAQRADGPSA